MQSHCVLCLHRHVFIFTLFPHCLTAHFLRDCNNITIFDYVYTRRYSKINDIEEPTCQPSSSSYTSFGVGRMFYQYPLCFLDLTANARTSFPSRFSFSINPYLLRPFGDGFTFFTTSNAASYSRSSANMALPEATTTQDS